MRVLGFSVVAVGFAGLVFGCAGQSSAREKALAELRDKILVLENERDRFEERLSAVEDRQLLGHAEEPKPPRESRPPLKVVVLHPRHPSEVSSSDAPSEAEAPSALDARPGSGVTSNPPSSAVPSTARAEQGVRESSPEVDAAARTGED